MQIFQMNVRLAEGGAAGVALDLHRRSLEHKVSSTFIYGYGKGGKKSVSHDLYENVIKNTNFITSSVNLLTFKYLNYDFFGQLDSLTKSCSRLTKGEIVVLHFHVIHSYWLNYHKLISTIEKIKKKHIVRIVWTLHDHWALTGRCAFLNDCDGWTSGCKKCPQLDNYPPVKKDHASLEIINKRRFIKDLADYGCTFVSPSKHVADSFNSLYGNSLHCTVVNNGIDIDSEKFLSKELSHILNQNEEVKNHSEDPCYAIVAHDLAYNGKTNFSFISSLIDANPNCKFHFYGKNSPFIGDNVHNHGFFSNKMALLKELKNKDALIFTSKVDNYPLILCEAMSLGVPILATKSDAADEVLSKVNGITLEEDTLKGLISHHKSKIIEIIYGCDVELFKSKSRVVFSGNTMLNQYIKIYENI